MNTIRNKNIIEDYCSGISINEIIGKHKCSYQTCVRLLKQNNIKIRTSAEASLLANGVSEQTKEKVVQLYLNGTSIRKTALALGINRQTCNSILKNKNIQLREWDNRTYKVNDFYFSQIDSENKAYWLGFLMADGCVCGSDNALVLGLSSKDRNHLEKFKNDLEAEIPIYDRLQHTGYSKNTFFSSIKISSKQIKNDLQKNGIFPQKTFVAKPIEINNSFARHFWRGMVDGDGWVCKYETKSVIGLCGTYEIVDGFAKFIAEALGFKKLVPKKHSSIFKIVYCGTQNIKQIASLLYGNADAFLDRKKKIADIIAG